MLRAGLAVNEKVLWATKLEAKEKVEVSTVLADRVVIQGTTQATKTTTITAAGSAGSRRSGHSDCPGVARPALCAGVRRAAVRGDRVSWGQQVNKTGNGNLHHIVVDRCCVFKGEVAARDPVQADTLAAARRMPLAPAPAPPPTAAPSAPQLPCLAS